MRGFLAFLGGPECTPSTQHNSAHGVPAAPVILRVYSLRRSPFRSGTLGPSGGTMVTQLAPHGKDPRFVCLDSQNVPGMHVLACDSSWLRPEVDDGRNENFKQEAGR